MEKVYLKLNECKGFTSKKGTSYKVFNIGGTLEVEREIVKRISGGWKIVTRMVDPTKEMLEKFELEQR